MTPGDFSWSFYITTARCYKCCLACVYGMCMFSSKQTFGFGFIQKKLSFHFFLHILFSIFIICQFMHCFTCKCM